MNLTNFFSLIINVLFQQNGSLIKGIYQTNTFNKSSEEAYNSIRFRCPKVWANDGMNISLQIHKGNYCCSDKGYRIFSENWIEVEFGFPKGLNAQSEALIAPFGELNDVEDVILTSDFGKIPIAVLEEIFLIHGGVDWNKTCKGLINN